MSSSVSEMAPLALDVVVTDDEIRVALEDGRKVSVPLAWFPRLLQATREQRADFRLIGGGGGIHWPELDEDLSVAGLLRGTRPQTNRQIQASLPNEPTSA